MPGEPFLQQLLFLPTVLYALLSPDRRWVAFMWYRIHANVDVFLVPSDGSAPPVALSHTPEYTELVSWTADSQTVILSEDHDGDERARLFRVDLKPGPAGQMQPLTADRPPYFIRGGQLSPDGNMLYYGANYDFASGQVLDETWIYRHDLKSDWHTPIAKPKQPAFTTPELNRAGTHLIYGSKDRHPVGVHYHLVDIAEKQDREILYFGDRAKVFARWFPDSQHILVISESTDPSLENTQGYKSLGIYHWPSKTLRWLVDDPSRLIEGAWISPDGSIVVDEVQSTAHLPTFISSLGNGWDFQKSGLYTELIFPRLAGNLIPLGKALSGDWVALYYSSSSPAELVRFNIDSWPAGFRAASPAAEGPMMDPPVLTSLTQVWEHTSLHSAELAPAERFSWPSEDGVRIQGWLYRALPNPHRAVLYIHGGPSAHSEDKLNPEIQYLVSQGFNVLDVNYRGSTGYGLKFRESIKQDGWGGREQADIAAGALALMRAGLAEPGRVGVTGTSYGGYSSWCLITHYPPDVIAAAAPICGMTDLVVDYQTTRPDLRPLSEEMIGGSPEQVPERYFERSPINFVQDIRGRLLIIQGAQDPNVSPENVRQVVERLEVHHISYELLVFEDEGHGITKPANQARLYARLADFFNSALG